MAPSGRLDGWKAIGGHFGRDRTTVMRWAQQRSLPVRRLPGGKTGTVYAFVHELDQWAASQGNLNDEPQQPDAAGDVPVILPPAGFWARNWRRLAMVSLMGLALIFAIGNVWPRAPRPTTAPTLPSDPSLSAAYLEARDAWAQRTPQSLAHAIDLFGEITRKDANFAPAWAGLADAYLLSREFGALSDADAFAKAREAAQNAARLDPGLGSAHRALGFISYWWQNDPEAAGKSFERALTLSPRDAQTHFWYGNILSDNGQHVKALRELNTARLIEPGSVAIQTDLAWAQWVAGNDAEASKAFGQLMQQHPDFPVLHDCLSIIRLGDGDYVGYVQDFSEFARLRGDAQLMQQAATLRKALKSGANAVQAQLMAYALSEIKARTRSTHVWPIFLASVAQDRAQTLRLLKIAEARKETWGEAGLTARIARLWPDDAEISTLVRNRRAPPVG